ncbi:YggS family pyridoxal phosphate-dependent enzyme [Psychrobacter jeotgali]|uniref:YggS family pyridoxal phosphate-dependent enzyme n=1 Tax=Psychrobacter jeotgali TaxID=179010 RepID=UPI00191B3821|nr:YggS family pyridoxal phosphate-dependent enzyme [Psychrobacter jeotgali]
MNTQPSLNQKFDPHADFDKNNSNSIDKPLLIDNWQQVRGQLEQACSQAHISDMDKVKLLAVSKTKPAEMIASLAQEGQRDFGENYLQEAIEKIKALQGHQESENVVWHYIGHIQRNKTRDIAEHFDWVQTIERDIIAKRLNEQRPQDMSPLKVLIQVNIDDEESKSGCRPEELQKLIETIKDYERLQLRGLMIIPAVDDTDAFMRTKQLFDEVKQTHPELDNWDTLSMGMSGDMTEAIAQGSTMVRVGTAIFGARD